MQYKEYAVAAPLAPFIKSIWCLKAPAGMYHLPERLIPDGTTAICLNFGSTLIQTRNEADKYSIALQGGYFLGQRMFHLFHSCMGSVDFVCVLIKPIATSLFINRSADDMTSAAHLFCDIQMDFYRKLEDCVYPLRQTNERIRILQNLLSEQIAKNSCQLNVLHQFSKIYERVSNSSSVADVLRSCSISKKKLGTDFAKYIGVHPKEFQRILRLNSAIRHYTNHPGNNLTSLAYECGYYDQAHMIHEFIAFTGLPPVQYFRSCSRA